MLLKQRYEHIRKTYTLSHVAICFWLILLLTLLGSLTMRRFALNTHAQEPVDVSIDTIMDSGITTPWSPIDIQYIFSNNTPPYTGATDIVVTVTLADGLSPSSSIPAWNSQSGNTYSYSIPDGSSDFVIQFEATTDGAIANGIYYAAASVSAHQPDPNPANNISTWYVLIIDDINQQVDLAIAATMTWSNTPAGQVEYTVIYENKSSVWAYGVDVFVYMSQWLQNIQTSVTPTSVSGTLYRWHIWDMAAWETGVIMLDGIVSALLESGYVLAFEANISGILQDSDGENNTAFLTHTVVDPQISADISLLSESASLCLWSQYDMTIIRQNINNPLSGSYIQLSMPTQMWFYNGQQDHVVVETGIYRWYINNGDIGVLDFTINANQLWTNLTLSAHLADESWTVYVQTSDVFSIVTCANDNGWDNGWDDAWDNGSNNGEDSTPPSDPSNDVQQWQSQGGWHGSAYIHMADDTQDQYTEEELAALYIKSISCIQWAEQIYTYAHDKQITTMSTIQNARLCDPVTRIELAKMLTMYAKNQLNKEPDTSIVCLFDDLDAVPTWDREYAVSACQLGLMGINTNGIFNPYGTVTRDMFATTLSRVLFNDRYNNAYCWYCSHVFALQKAGIMNYVDPSMVELRWYIMTAMYRTTDLIQRVMNR